MMNNSQHEIMAIAQEECAEVIQVISKVFRFGFSGKHPDESYNNREHLAIEVGDLQCMIDLMIEQGLVEHEDVMIAAEAKREKLKIWSSIFK